MHRLVWSAAGFRVPSVARLLRALGALGLALVLALVGTTASAATTEPIPSSMAGLGDSITRGFNACAYYLDCPERSWSTGVDANVNSHYLRILAKNPAISGKGYNDARTGARMVDLDRQAQSAVAQGVAYVTILMGANDACTSTEASMTPVSTYRSQLEQAMATLTAGLPTASILVVSVPDIGRLWYIGKDSFRIRNTWDTLNVCQSMLANPGSTAPADMDRRRRVRQRVVDYNAVLAGVCATHAHCRFDGNALFNYPFTLDLVSQWDYFHPNAVGQRVVAEVSYRAGFGW